MIDIVQAYTTVAVYFDLEQIRFALVAPFLEGGNAAVLTDLPKNKKLQAIIGGKNAVHCTGTLKTGGS